MLTRGASLVNIWDDASQSCIAQIEHRSSILRIAFRRERLVVCLVDKVFIYRVLDPFDLRLLQVVDTFDNPHGMSFGYLYPWLHCQF